MEKYLYTLLGLSIIFVCTTLGSSVVFFFKKNMSANIKRIILGFSSGIMVSASIFSLLLPALQSTDTNTYMPEKLFWIIPTVSFIFGCLLMWGLDKVVPHIHKEKEETEGLKTNKISRGTKLFLAVTLHNIPEGLSVGIAFGSALAMNNEAMLLSALLLALGIGIQNVPEGAAVSLPLLDEGYTKTKAFLFGTFSGLVEPIAGIFGFLLAAFFKDVMPFALALSAGCMIYVVIEDLIPQAQLDSINHYGTWSFIVGFVVMMILDTAIWEN